MIPYGRQTVGDADVQAVLEVLRGDWLTQGPTIERFERAVAERVEAAWCVAFSSGTAALHASVAVSELGPGDVVVTSPLTFVASANCARYVGATPSLIDLDPATWNLDVRRVPARAAGLVAVHYAGLPVDLDALTERPKVVIEDAAHALGASSASGPVGNCAHSDLCCFSLHPVKPITSGEGGLVTTNDAALAEALRRFRSHGMVSRPERGGWVYDVASLGFNYRMTDLQAALGLSQLARLDEFIERRAALATRYREAFAGTDVLAGPSAPAGVRHGHHLFVVHVPRRHHVYDAMRAAGIGVQVHYVPVHHHSLGADLELPPEGLPICEEVYRGVLSLPLFPSLTEDEQDLVIDTLLEVVTEGPGADGAARPPIAGRARRRVDQTEAALR